jgi:HNH endonuclease
MTQETLKKEVYYDPETGVFKRHNSERIIGTTTNGYGHIFIGGKAYQTSRLAWLYVYGTWPKIQIDHINRDASDDRIVNLRDVSQSENNRNRVFEKKPKPPWWEGWTVVNSI